MKKKVTAKKRPAKKVVVKKVPRKKPVDPDKGQPKTIQNTQRIKAEIVQIEYHPGEKGRTDVHIYLDQGKSKVLITGIRNLCMDGVWVVFSK